MVIVLFVVSVLVFLIFNVIPNSPPAQRLAGKNATPTLVKSIEEEWGFDESLPEQYLTMMKKVFTNELISYSPRVSVEDRINEGIPATLSLAIGAGMIWLFFGDGARLPLGGQGRRLARQAAHRRLDRRRSRSRSS